jgi:excinuclease UvrABC nuclease subunit
MKRFQSLDKIRSATVEELAETPGMNGTAALKVYEFLH